MQKRRLLVFRPSGFFPEEFFNNFFDDSQLAVLNDSVEVEMYDDDENVIVKIKAPGFEKEDFDISVEDNVLTVSGSVEEEKKEEDKKKKYYYRELRQESFSRSVTLPVRIVSEKANAEYKKGILTVSLPKSEEIKPKKITVKSS